MSFRLARVVGGCSVFLALHHNLWPVLELLAHGDDQLGRTMRSVAPPSAVAGVQQATRDRYAQVVALA